MFPNFCFRFFVVKVARWKNHINTPNNHFLIGDKFWFGLTEFARSHCVDQSIAFPLLELCVKSQHGGGQKYNREESN